MERHNTAAMRLLWWFGMLSALVLWLAPPAAGARDNAIRGVISDQIAALEADDFDRAFDFASPGIRSFFGTPDRFGRMVREGYPMVYRPDSLRFGALRESRGRVWQRVIVTDPAGRLHLLEYEMVDTDAGWRINAVMLVPVDAAGA